MEHDKIDIVLSVSDDRLAVLLDCDVPDAAPDALVEKIQNQLKALKISLPIDRPSIEQKIAAAQTSGGRIVGECLVRGVAPIAPRDAVLEWAREFFDPGFVVDPETGRIDYRRRSGQPSVQEGELLARLLPAREGRPGTDVFGKRIPIGRPNHLRIRVGPNVRDTMEEGVHLYHAAAAGRVRWASDLLAVDDVLMIDGDVGLETGHIRHTGAVTINGDVLAGSKIEAEGDVEIHGSVEPSDIQTGGSLHVDQGITGAKGRKIIAGGGVRAKYLMEVDIEADEDILVESEIIHSNLKTRGRICMPNGRLIGGEAMAQSGLDLRESGNARNAPTRIIVGEDFRRARELSVQKERDAQAKARLEQLRKELEAYNSKQTLTAQDRESMTELQFEEWELANSIDSAQQGTVEAEDRPIRPASRIVVRGTLYSETEICFASTKVVISEEMPGPLVALFTNDKLRLHKLEQSHEQEVALA